VMLQRESPLDLRCLSTTLGGVFTQVRAERRVVA
jgi:hypothetical protein